VRKEPQLCCQAAEFRLVAALTENERERELLDGKSRERTLTSCGCRKLRK
jgi:hypothetical protein